MTSDLYPVVTPDLTHKRPAAETRAGAAFTHSIFAIAEMGEAGVTPNDRQHTLATGERHGHSF